MGFLNSITSVNCFRLFFLFHFEFLEKETWFLFTILWLRYLVLLSLGVKSIHPWNISNCYHEFYLSKLLATLFYEKKVVSVSVFDTISEVMNPEIIKLSRFFYWWYNFKANMEFFFNKFCFCLLALSQFIPKIFSTTVITFWLMEIDQKFMVVNVWDILKSMFDAQLEYVLQFQFWKYHILDLKNF